MDRVVASVWHRDGLGAQIPGAGSCDEQTPLARSDVGLESPTGGAARGANPLIERESRCSLDLALADAAGKQTRRVAGLELVSAEVKRLEQLRETANGDWRVGGDERCFDRREVDGGDGWRQRVDIGEREARALPLAAGDDPRTRRRERSPDSGLALEGYNPEEVRELCPTVR